MRGRFILDPSRLCPSVRDRYEGLVLCGVRRAMKTRRKEIKRRRLYLPATVYLGVQDRGLHVRDRGQRARGNKCACAFLIFSVSASCVEAQGL